MSKTNKYALDFEKPILALEDKIAELKELSGGAKVDFSEEIQKLEKKARKPYHLALVIDRSGSMSGPPLAEAVRCARHMVDRLEPTDTASLVVFDDRVRTLAPAAPVGDRKVLHLALSQVHSGGSTNLHGGWQAGADGLLPGAAGAALARVILLSDGNANVGAMTDTPSIAACCAKAAEAGVTTSTSMIGSRMTGDALPAPPTMPASPPGSLPVGPALRRTPGPRILELVPDAQVHLVARHGREQVSHGPAHPLPGQGEHQRGEHRCGESAAGR